MKTFLLIYFIIGCFYCILTVIFVTRKIKNSILPVPLRYTIFCYFICIVVIVEWPVEFITATINFIKKRMH